MTSIYIILVFIIAAIIIISVFNTNKQNHAIKNLSVGRQSLNDEELRVLANNKNIDQDTISIVIKSLNDVIGHKTPFRLNDRLISDLLLDPRDVEDIMEEFTTSKEINIDRNQPIPIPYDPTVFQIIQMCQDYLSDNRQRK